MCVLPSLQTVACRKYIAVRFPRSRITQPDKPRHGVGWHYTAIPTAAQIPDRPKPSIPAAAQPQGRKNLAKKTSADPKLRKLG